MLKRFVAIVAAGVCAELTGLVLSHLQTFSNQLAEIIGFLVCFAAVVLCGSLLESGDAQ